MDVPSPNSQILLIDDCNFNLYAVQSLLQQFELHADICNSGDRAL